MIDAADGGLKTSGMSGREDGGLKIAAWRVETRPTGRF
jgi:hypothetical protein